MEKYIKELSSLQIKEREISERYAKLEMAYDDMKNLKEIIENKIKQNFLKLQFKKSFIKIVLGYNLICLIMKILTKRDY